ncbi:DNA polymerase III subunit delta [compost metagenome]
MATMMRGWLNTKLLAERGMNADAIAQALGARSTYKIKKDLEQCRSWSSRQLREALSLVLETDLALKGGVGRGMEALQLEKLLVQLARL